MCIVETGADVMFEWLLWLWFDGGELRLPAAFKFVLGLCVFVEGVGCISGVWGAPGGRGVGVAADCGRKYVIGCGQ